jgi:alpha-L-fucosidase
MGWPGEETAIGSLGTASKPEAGKVQNVELLGFKGKVRWKQEATGLRVQMPAEKLSDYSITFKIALA